MRRRDAPDATSFEEPYVRPTEIESGVEEGRAVKRSLGATAAALVVIAASLVPAAPAGAAGQDAFTGRWVGVEFPVGDGSTDYMVISGPNAQGTRTWRYWETNASGYCSPGGGGPLAAAGTSHSVGDTLTVTVTSTECANGLPGAFPPPFDLSMTATDDGQINWGGVILSRS
jgi:hypothetical protein